MIEPLRRESKIGFGVPRRRVPELLPAPGDHPELGLIRWALSGRDRNLWCAHLRSRGRLEPRTHECQECLSHRASWRRLRLCCSCGYVGCCENSRHRHAERHFHGTGHPVMRSIDPERLWSFCSIDQIRVLA